MFYEDILTSCLSLLNGGAVEFARKRDRVLILINKAEKEAMNSCHPEVTVIRTARGKSKRHRYYCEETSKTVRFLESLRNKREVTRYASR